MVRRVCVLAYHSSPLLEPGSGDAGGMTVYVRELAATLAEQGVYTDIFTRAAADRPRVAELSPGVRVVSIDAGPRAAVAKDRLRQHISEFIDGVRTFGIAQRARYEVVHSHYWQSGVAGKAIAAPARVPLVHSQHTLARVKNNWLAPGDTPEPAARITGEEEVIRSADVLVASTAEEWRQLAELYGATPERLKIIYPGVDQQLFQPGSSTDARRALGYGPGPLLLAVGRIQALKGLDLAIEALGRIPEPAQLVIVGGASGPGGEAELTRLRELAISSGLADRVVFEGPRPHRLLPDYYRAADALLVCSHSESFGLAALEAQACGTPVVGTRVGGLPDVVADGSSGLLISERDPQLFGEAISRLLSEPNRVSAFGAAARERALRFSWKKTAESFLELYECLVREESSEACTC